MIFNLVEGVMTCPKKITFEDNPIRLEQYRKVHYRGADKLVAMFRPIMRTDYRGSEPQHSPERPRQLTEEQEKELYRTIVEKTPVDVRCPAYMNWTSLLIRDWINSRLSFSPLINRGFRLKIPFIPLFYSTF